MCQKPTSNGPDKRASIPALTHPTLPPLRILILFPPSFPVRPPVRPNKPARQGRQVGRQTGLGSAAARGEEG